MGTSHQSRLLATHLGSFVWRLKRLGKWWRLVLKIQMHLTLIWFARYIFLFSPCNIILVNLINHYPIQGKVVAYFSTTIFWRIVDVLFFRDGGNGTDDAEPIGQEWAKLGLLPKRALGYAAGHVSSSLSYQLNKY